MAVSGRASKPRRIADVSCDGAPSLLQPGQGKERKAQRTRAVSQRQSEQGLGILRVAPSASGTAAAGRLIKSESAGGRAVRSVQ
jgi:hypothetical protein